MTTWKNAIKKRPLEKNARNLEILKLLDKRFYAQEISQKISLSQKNLSRIINSFKERDLITQIQAYPKVYELTTLGKLILGQGDLSQRKISEFATDKRKSPKGLPPVRAHLDRFKNELIQKPSWLNRIRDRGITKGLTIKRVELKNWTKFLIYFNYQDFNGLDNIEVCNNIIIYNFKQKLGDQLVSSNEELDRRNNDLISNCKQARSFLQEKGFSIGQEVPVRCQKPHYAVTSNGDLRHIGSLGQELLMTVKTPTESIIIDDSPGIGGEEETDNIETAKSYLAIPQQLEDLETKITNLETKLSSLESAMIKMANGMEKMADIFSKQTEQPKQESTTPTESEGMYQ